MSETRIAARLRRRVAEHARHRCGYCRCTELETGIPLEIDHIIPEAAGGSSKEDNLWLSCIVCNRMKAAHTHGIDPLSGRRIRLFNPRRQSWKDHFEWSSDGTTIIGKTPCGQATVRVLHLNRQSILITRSHWIAADLHPPKED